MSFNKIILVGNLGRDPELRYTPQGLAVADFSMATNERKKDKQGEYQDVPTWFRVTLWRNQAENASKYLKKGSPVYIEGKLTLDEWQDRDGNTKYTLSIAATEMHFLGTNNSYDTASLKQEIADREMNATEAPTSIKEMVMAKTASTGPADDDIPF